MIGLMLPREKLSMNDKSFDRKSERRSRFDRKKKFKKISSAKKLKETKRNQNITSEYYYDYEKTE